MKKFISAFMLLLMAAVPAQAYAGFEASSWTENDSYWGKTGDKLVFGLKNTFLGIGDIFYEPSRYQSEGKSVWLGIGKGLIDAPLNIIEGLLHVVTFPIPLDVPLPDGGVNFADHHDHPNPNTYKVKMSS